MMRDAARHERPCFGVLFSDLDPFVGSDLSGRQSIFIQVEG